MLPPLRILYPQSYLLQLCNIKVDNFKDFTIPSDQQENFFHSLKNLLHEYFIKYWKEQIQQGGNNGKLRVYKTEPENKFQL